MHIGHRLVRAAALGLLLSGTSAFAQQQAPPVPGAGTARTADDPTEDIVVTAQARRERLQDVPISAQVIGGEARLERNYNSLQTLAQTVPSVHIAPGGRSDDLFIRGIGSGQNQAFDQSVGTFIDGIYHGRSRANAGTFLDLDRVEILKGPQSTFFGNNAIAGAFNIVTTSPGSTPDGYVRALYGEHGQYALEGAATVPLGDTFSVRVAGTANGMSGWSTNVTDGERQPRLRNAAGRVTFGFTPSDTFDATLKIEGSRNRNRGGLFLKIDRCPPPAPFATTGFCSVALANGLAGQGRYETGESPGQRIDLDTFETVLRMNLHLGEHVLTSITGYQEYDYLLRLDADATPPTLLNVQAPERYHQFSQELRIASPDNRRFEYLAGAYFQADRMTFPQDTNYTFLTPVISGIPPFAGLVPYLPLAQEIQFEQPERIFSVFGSLSWNATDALRLTASLRASWVHKSYEKTLFFGTATAPYGGVQPLPAPVAGLPALLGLGVPGTLTGTRDDHAVMPSANLQYRFTPNVMGYLSYARGFKAGGFNGGDITGVAANVPFSPEYVDAYEAGIKSELFGRRLVLNLAAFRSDYRDLQVATNTISPSGTFISLIRNAAAARSQGIELEARWRLFPAFRLSATATYLDSVYRRYQNVSPTTAQAAQGIQLQDLSGQPTQYAPRWSGNVTATHVAGLGSGLELTSELTALFSSRYFLSPINDPLQRQPGFTRIDARLSLASRNGRWAVDLIGKNLTNRDIFLFATNLPTSPGVVLRQNQQPRNLAVQLRYSW